MGVISFLLGRGYTVIDEGVSLPSKVTYLKIKKPPKFNYSPGDWCFIKIPSIATFEWHPFTISSAPEDPNHFSVHIRGVGHWTNKLYSHFQAINNKEKLTPVMAEGLGPERPLEIMVDGPFGSPSSNIYRAEHAVLVGTGIGVTPFASILQSISHRYLEIKQSCPSCSYSWTNNIDSVMGDLKKGSRDLVTGLKSRTNAGRPNWNKVFAKIREQKVGKITVFFCGNPTLGKMLKAKCDEFGFTFRKEVF